MSPNKWASCNVAQATRAAAMWTSSNRFRGRAAAGARDSRNRNGQLCGGALQGAFRHGACHGLGNSSRFNDQIFRNSQQLCFRAVRIDDEAALEDIRRPRDFREQRADETAGAALRGRNPQTLRARPIENVLGQSQEFHAEHRVREQPSNFPPPTWGRCRAQRSGARRRGKWSRPHFPLRRAGARHLPHVGRAIAYL